MVVGEDVFIDPHVNIRRPEQVFIGDHVAIDYGFHCTTLLQLGSYIHIGPHVSIIGGKDVWFQMRSFTTIGAGTVVICRGDSFNGNGLVSAPAIPDKFKNDVLGSVITMMSFSSLGAHVVVMPDVWIAMGVVVGANSLVTKPITEPWTIWVGSPARKIKDRPREKMLAYARELGYGYE